LSDQHVIIARQLLVKLDPPPLRFGAVGAGHKGQFMNYREYRRQRLDELRTTPRMADGGTYRNFVDGLIDLLEQVPLLRRVLEIGCAHGVSTETLLLYAREVWAVDPWEPPYDFYHDFLRRCGDYPHLIVIRGRSPDALPAGMRTFDLVYIDGDHEYAAVVADIAAALYLLHDGGVLAGHDWSAHGVQVAVLEFWRRLGRDGLPKVFADGSWMIQLRGD